MALVGPALLTADPDTSNVASYATPSVSPTANAGLLAFVWNTDGTDAVQGTFSSAFSIVGGGNWALEGSIQSANLVRRLSLFSATATGSPGSGAGTADFGGDAQTGCSIVIVEYTGQDTSDFVLQVTTNLAASGQTSEDLTLGSALGAAGNQIIAAIGHTTQEAQTAGSGATELAGSDIGYATPAMEMGVYHETNDNVVSASWTTSAATLSIGCEVVEDAGGATHERSAAIAATGALAASGLHIAPRAVAISATGDVQVSGVVIPGSGVHERSVAISGASTITVAGLHIAPRSAAITASGNVVVTGQLVAQRQVALTGASLVAVSGVRIDPGAQEPVPFDPAAPSGGAGLGIPGGGVFDPPIPVPG